MLEGAADGAADGDNVGCFDGPWVGATVGCDVGAVDGGALGSFVGPADGSAVGMPLGPRVGADEGSMLGACEGPTVGPPDGDAVGGLDGPSVWWLHAPGYDSSIAVLSAAEVTKPVLQRLASLSHPHMNVTPFADTGPSQSLLHTAVKHGSADGEIVGSAVSVRDGAREGR